MSQQPSVSELKQGITAQLQQQQVSSMVQAASPPAAGLSTVAQIMSNMCFKKCVDSPGSRLSSSEQRCLSQCSDRYMESLQAIQQAFIEMYRPGSGLTSLVAGRRQQQQQSSSGSSWR